MEDLVSINVYVSTGMTMYPVSGAVTVTGEPDELFQDAVERSVREQLDPSFTDRLVGINWYDPDYPERLHVIYPAEMSLAAAREYFGEEVDASPPTIRVDDGGYGGGEEFVAYAIELLDAGMAAAGYVAAGLAAQRALVKLRYGRFRQLATDWNDGDFISPALREAVLAKPIWTRSEFNKTFGLDAHRGPQLLRTLGYSRRDFGGVEHWQRSLDEP